MNNNKMTITVLKPLAYNRLHRKHKNIKFRDLRQSLGLALPKENKAYIRLTPDYETNKAVIMHEMEELIADKSPHEINGVRYGFSDWWKKFTSKPFRTLERTFIPENKWARTATNIALGFAGPFGPALAAGYGALGGSKNVPEGTSFGKSILPVAWGGLQGYGLGALGKGIGSGIHQAYMGAVSKGFRPLTAMKNFGTGFRSGLGTYAGTPLIPGLSKTAPSTWFSRSTSFSPAGAAGPTGQPGVAGPTGQIGTQDIGANLATGKTGLTPTSTGMPSTIDATSTGLPSIDTGVGTGMESSKWMPSELGSGLMPAPVTATTETGKTLLQKIGSTLFGEGKGLLGAAGSLLGPMMMMGGSGAAGMAAEPPIPQYNPEEYVKRAKETMERYNLNALPEYAQEEAREMIELPISGPELEAKVDDAFGRIEQNLEMSREHQIQAVNRQYAQAGATGDTQQAEDVARINQYINAEKVVARAETRATVLSQAYGVKKSALQTVMTSGQWDSQLAMQLSNLFGNEDELINSLQAEDYASFQQSMSDIFGMGASQLAEIIMRRMFPEQNVA